jgi:hypothetical protein
MQYLYLRQRWLRRTHRQTMVRARRSAPQMNRRSNFVTVAVATDNTPNKKINPAIILDVCVTQSNFHGMLFFSSHAVINLMLAIKG